MSEEELLAAVLEISKREASPSLSHEDDEKPTSSPDTGFAEDDIQEMPENPDSVETEKELKFIFGYTPNRTKTTLGH